jgi:hypothetical protein
MRYFIKIPDLAIAETDETAARLIEKGYKECPRAYLLTWWELRDAARGAELIVLAWKDAATQERTVGNHD